jgi:hypothetical protein
VEDRETALDADGTMRRANPVGEPMTGTPFREASGHPTRLRREVEVNSRGSFDGRDNKDRLRAALVVEDWWQEEACG